MKYTLYFNYSVGDEFEAEPREIYENLHQFIEGFFLEHRLHPQFEEGQKSTNWVVEVEGEDARVAEAFGPAVRAFIEVLVEPYSGYKWMAGNYTESANRDFIYILYDIDHNDKVCITFVPITMAEEIEDGSILPGTCQ
ncbi:MAG: hypothetical protein ACRCVN_00850 [Spirochaetia bacterium]